MYLLVLERADSNAMSNRRPENGGAKRTKSRTQYRNYWGKVLHRMIVLRLPLAVILENDRSGEGPLSVPKFQADRVGLGMINTMRHNSNTKIKSQKEISRRFLYQG
jgi:hypothetical protein